MFFACAHNTFALDYNPDVNGFVRINDIKCHYRNNFNVPGYRDSEKWGCSAFASNTGVASQLGSGNVSFDKTVPKDTVMTVYSIVYSAANTGSLSEMPALTFSNHASVIDQRFLVMQDHFENPASSVGSGTTANLVNASAYFVASTVYVSADITGFNFNGPFGSSYWSVQFLESVSYLGTSSASAAIDAGNKAEQDRYDDAKNESDNNKNDAQDKSDSAQSDVDNSSKNLLQILTDFVSAITGTSAGSCDITGDFGFFNAGTINLCTGAGKIVPITTIVGTIMLVGLCVPAVITLLHRFLDLYNEVTN